MSKHLAESDWALSMKMCSWGVTHSEGPQATTWTRGRCREDKASEHGMPTLWQPPPAAFWVRHGAALPGSWGCKAEEFPPQLQNPVRPQLQICVTSLPNWRIRGSPFFLIRLLVLDFWAGLKNECCILKTNRVLCCCFGVWLPVCSVLNLAELLHRALAETESLRFIFYRGIRTAGADTRRSGDGGSKLSSAAMVEQWRSGAGPDTTLVEIRGNCSELMKTWHCPWCWSSRHFGHCVVFSCQFLYVCTSITFPLHDQSDNMYFFFLQNCEVELSLMVMSFCGRCTVHGCWAILTVKNEEIGGCFTSQELAWLHAQS